MSSIEEFKAARGVRAIRLTPDSVRRPRRDKPIKSTQSTESSRARGGRTRRGRTRRGRRTLTDGQERQVIELYFDQGLSRKETSKRLDIGEHAVQLCLAREEGRREERAKWVNGGAHRDAG